MEIESKHSFREFFSRVAIYQPPKTVTDDEPKRAAVGAFLATKEVNVFARWYGFKFI